jgi:hypothetical protein
MVRHQESLQATRHEQPASTTYAQTERHFFAAISAGWCLALSLGPTSLFGGSKCEGEGP